MEACQRRVRFTPADSTHNRAIRPGLSCAWCLILSTQIEHFLSEHAKYPQFFTCCCTTAVHSVTQNLNYNKQNSPPLAAVSPSTLYAPYDPGSAVFCRLSLHPLLPLPLLLTPTPGALCCNPRPAPFRCCLPAPASLLANRPDCCCCRVKWKRI